MVKTYFFIVKSFFENTFFNHIENSHRVIQGFLSTNLLLNSFAESYWKYSKSKGEHEIFIFGKRNCWRLDSMMKSFLFYFRIFFRRNRLWRDSFKIISSIFSFIFGKKLFNWKYSIRKLLHKKNNFQNTKKTIFELYWKWHSHSSFTFPSLLAKNYWDDVPIIEKRFKLTRRTYLIYFNIRWDFFKNSLSLKKKNYLQNSYLKPNVILNLNQPPSFNFTSIPFPLALPRAREKRHKDNAMGGEAGWGGRCKGYIVGVRSILILS